MSDDWHRPCIKLHLHLLCISFYLLFHCSQTLNFGALLVLINCDHRCSFVNFEQNFPFQILKRAIESYPTLDEGKLKSELGVIYKRREFRQC